MLMDGSRMGSISDSDSNDDLEEVSSRQSQVHERLIVFRDLLRFMIFLEPLNLTLRLVFPRALDFSGLGV